MKSSVARSIAACIAILAAMAIPARAQEPRAAAASLTREQAQTRAARISNVRYALEFELDGESSDFQGRVRLRFELADSMDDLSVDFFGGAVSEVEVNGARVDASYNGFFLTLPAARLRSGGNTVEIAFTHPYGDDGNGLYRFTDPEDGRDYLYTDFEPYDQNRLFPSFDQPNLKARYSTRVTVPASWQVISNTLESSVTGEGDRRIWQFSESPPLSTYVYALHAGQYHRWDSNAGEIPLRLFARESLVPYVHAEDWMLPTQQGFEFYQDYFDVPYAFGKYDQIIVPHFNAGAMENVGAVTFSERFLQRGTVTRQNRRSISSVILHEMAHMWFGDLVTMDWWNGIWLNESFATFMATLAMVNATEFDDEWQSSYRRTSRAYQADERDTTHPIEMPITDTDAAFANFDAITYNKGSATLTQLQYLVGPEAFRRGVSEYLKTHAYGNSTIDDFLDAISAATGRDLGPWASDWLHTPGTNTVSVALECEDGAIQSLELDQGAPEAWPRLRTHRTQLGLYHFDGGHVTIRTLPTTYSGERTAVEAARGQPCPDLIYANHGDWDYARVRLDDAAITTLREHINDFDDALARAMLWQSIYDRVLGADLAPIEFIGFALENIAAEPDDEVARQILGSIADAWSYVVRIDAEDAAAREAGSRLEAQLWQGALEATPGSDRQLMLFDRYVAAVASRAGLERLVGFLEAERGLPDGLVLDQDRRWTVLEQLGEFGLPHVEGLLAAERRLDNSDRGRLRALSVVAARPERAQQRRLMEQLLAPESAGLSVAEARAIAAGLFPDRQQAQQLELTSEVLRRLPGVSDDVEPVYFGSITRGLLGTICDSDYLGQLETAIGDADSLHPSLRKSLLDMRFEVERCLAIAEAL